jgi:hypothetical protein
VGGLAGRVSANAFFAPPEGVRRCFIEPFAMGSKNIPLQIEEAILWNPSENHNSRRYDDEK